MPLEENPYYHRGPIREAAHFYGRERETARALQMVKNGQSVSVIGPRRIGKTSFLFHLADPAVRAAHGLDPVESPFVYVDGQLLAGLSGPAILRVLLDGIAAQAEGIGSDGAQASDYLSFERAVREWGAPGRRLVFLIDEFECLSKNPRLADDFPAFLRGLANLPHVVYVTASEIPLLSLMNGEEGLTPFFNIFTPVHLGLFDEADTRRLVREPAQAAGVNFSQEAEDLILQLAGPHPFFLQVTCFYAFDLWREDSRLGKRAYAQLEKQVQADLESHFKYFTDRLSDQQRQALARLWQTKSTENLVTAHSLEQACLIRRAGERYVLVSRAFAQFVEQRVGVTWAASVAEGERRMSTVLFADVTGFTSLTEQRPPEDILAITKRAQQIFVDVVDRHGGMVGNFGGDSLMALFGVPVERADDAVRAVRAAVEIQTEVAKFAGELEQRDRIKFSARVGLDTGVVILGRIGGEQRSEYTALGDPVNLARRMETLAQPGGVVLSEHTFQQVRGRFKLAALGRQHVKGKSSPIKAYQVLGEKANTPSL